METFERQIRTELHDRADDLLPTAAPIEAVVHAGHRRRTRHRVTVVGLALAAAASTIAVLGATGVFTATEAPQPAPATPAHSPSSPPSASPSSAGRLSLGPITPCADLPPIPDGVSIDTVLNYVGGELMLSFPQRGTGGEQVTFVVDYRNDAGCVRRGDILTEINHALRTVGRAPLRPPS